MLFRNGGKVSLFEYLKRFSRSQEDNHSTMWIELSNKKEELVEILTKDASYGGEVSD